MIVHVGTNDLTKNVKDTSDNMKQIVEHIRNTSENTEIILSNICYREDRTGIDILRQKANTTFENLGKELDVRVIDNHNIDQSCLSRKRLHLNRKGLAQLSKNMKGYLIKNFNHPEKMKSLICPETLNNNRL